MVITINGKAGSGKSTLCDKLVLLTTGEFTEKIVHINLDKWCDAIMSKKDRIRILNESGIEKLEKLIYPKLKKRVKEFIDYKDYKIYLLDGIKAKELFEDISDFNLDININDDIRLKRLKDREGDSDERVNFIESLSD